MHHCTKITITLILVPCLSSDELKLDVNFHTIEKKHINSNLINLSIKIANDLPFGSIWLKRVINRNLESYPI